MINKRCRDCKEILEQDYCYVCDGDELKRDQIIVDPQSYHCDEHDIFLQVIYN